MPLASRFTTCHSLSVADKSRLISSCGWCHFHTDKVFISDLQKMKTGSNQKFDFLLRRIPCLSKVAQKTCPRTLQSEDKSRAACTPTSINSNKKDRICSLHNWKMDMTDLVSLAEDPEFYTCCSFNPCSILTTGKARLRIRLAKTQFSQLARVPCGQHKQIRKLCDMTLCMKTLSWVCGPWAPCDKELLRQLGGDILYQIDSSRHSLHTQDLVDAIGDDMAICAVHKILRQKNQLLEVTTSDRRVKNVFVCKRENRCSSSIIDTPKEISFAKISKRKDRDGDWLCIDNGCKRRNSCMDFHCVFCRKPRSSRCVVILSKSDPRRIFPGCTPGDWMCLSCNRTNFLLRVICGTSVLQTHCHFCGSLKLASSPVVV